MTQVRTHTVVEPVMGTVASLTLRGERPDSPEADAAARRAFEVLQDAERVFSPWRGGSDLARLRRGEVTVEQCDPVVGEVLALCQTAQELTRGAFSIDLPVPGLAEDPHPVRRINPLGLVKGWALARAADQLEGVPGLDYCLNIGGDIAVGGTTGTAWQLGIEDPADPARIVDVVELVRGGMATSGTAARGAHLLDPATGTPVERTGSVTVVGPSPLWADVWATALFVGSPQLSLAELEHLALTQPGYLVVSH